METPVSSGSGGAGRGSRWQFISAIFIGPPALRRIRRQRAFQHEEAHLHTASLVRRVRFRAAHRYWRPEWSEERNRREFGSSAEPHEHDFEIEVAVTGPVDPETGFVVDLVTLDTILHNLVEPLERQILNEAVPRFRSGGEIPSTENLARWVWDRLYASVPGPARLDRVRVFESAELGAEYRGGEGDGSADGPTLP